MEFIAGMVAGALLWPWWALSIFILLVLVDAVLVENDSAGWGTFLMLTGTAMLVWLGSDVNPFGLAWDNAGNLLGFFALYFFVGAIWSIAKWYFHLINVRESMRTRKINSRPHNSYASNNKARIIGWIGHWPFSMIGTLFGDFLGKIVKSIYNSLSSVYERIEKSIFKEFN